MRIDPRPNGASPGGKIHASDHAAYAGVGTRLGHATGTGRNQTTVPPPRAQTTWIICGHILRAPKRRIDQPAAHQRHLQPSAYKKQSPVSRQREIQGRFSWLLPACASAQCFNYRDARWLSGELRRIGRQPEAPPFVAADNNKKGNPNGSPLLLVLKQRLERWTPTM